MKCLDVSPSNIRVQECGATILNGGPYHLYPDTGEVYDVIGNHIGTGVWEGKQLIVKPIDHSQAT